MYKHRCDCYSVKTLGNKWVFSFFLNDSTNWSTFLINNFNEFYMVGTAEENARSPKMFLDFKLKQSKVPL